MLVADVAEFVQEEQCQHFILVALKQHIALCELWKRQLEFLGADQDRPASFPHMGHHPIGVARFDGIDGDRGAFQITVLCQFKPKFRIVYKAVDDLNRFAELGFTMLSFAT